MAPYKMSIFFQISHWLNFYLILNNKLFVIPFCKSISKGRILLYGSQKSCIASGKMWCFGTYPYLPQRRFLGFNAPPTRAVKKNLNILPCLWTIKQLSNFPFPGSCMLVFYDLGHDPLNQKCRSEFPKFWCAKRNGIFHPVKSKWWVCVQFVCYSSMITSIQTF